jgi:hypothetical protein
MRILTRKKYHSLIRSVKIKLESLVTRVHKWEEGNPCSRLVDASLGEEEGMLWLVINESYPPLDSVFLLEPGPTECSPRHDKDGGRKLFSAILIVTGNNLSVQQ